MSEADAPTAQWMDVGSESDISTGSLHTWKSGQLQLVVGMSSEGKLFALDNRCPHEGYPLAQGDLKASTLTCCWHNWKFDVGSGHCLLGGEDVRSYPVRAVDGKVQVDVTPPPQKQERQRLRQSLSAALVDADLPRAMRDAVRLLQADYPVSLLLGDVALQDAQYAEYGSTHVLALAADTQRLLEATPGTSAAYALAPLLELCGETNRRLPRRPHPEPRTAASFLLFRQAVESEDLETAEALLRGAYQAGRSRQEVEQWLFAICSDHFLGLGHSLIYLIKSRELLDALPEHYAPEIHAALLVSIGVATREDTLPYLRSYFGPVHEWQHDFADCWSKGAGEDVDASGLVQVQEAVLDGKRPEAMQSVWGALQAGHAPHSVAQALVLAAAQRLLRFEQTLHDDVSVAENWLFATHRLTFASAVRNSMRRFESPDALHLLFQAAAFIHSGAAMDSTTPGSIPTEPDSNGHCSLEEIESAILRRDPGTAVSAVAQYLMAGNATAPLFAALKQCTLKVDLVRPIYQVHAIKTVLAALEEFDALGDHPERALPVLAAVRFLATPVREQRGEAAAHAAIEWVEHGRMLRKLTQ